MTMDSQIPYLPQLDDNILDSASRGRLIIFVGAGFSSIIGLPNWNELSKIYIDKVFDSKLINYQTKDYLLKLNPKTVLTICDKLLKENKIYMNLRELFSIKDYKYRKLRNLDLIEALYSFNSIFVTTNYDDSLDIVLEKKKIEQINSFPDTHIFDYNKCKSYYNIKDLLTSRLVNGNIFHLHGCINDESTIVMDISSYIKLYNNNKYSDVILRKIFNEHTVIFIGYGVEELEILEYLIEKKIEKKIDSNKTIKHYLLKGFYEGQQNMIDLLNKYYSDINVSLIAYNKTHKGYDQIIDIIKYWAVTLSDYIKPKKYLEQIKLIDEYLNGTQSK